MRHLLTLAFLPLLFSCTKYAPGVTNAGSANKQILPTRIDFQTIDLGDSTLGERQKRTVKHLEESPHKPLFIGRLSQSPALNFKGDYHTVPDYPWSNYKETESADIEIFVDTSRTIRHSTWLNYKFSGMGIEWITDSVEFASYPVFIKNLEPDTVVLGSGEVLGLYLEAKDPGGLWKTVHFPRFYSCGVGVNEILLPSHHYAVTSTPIYTGNFRTKLRLKLSTYSSIYSNEFYGEINSSQFEPKDDKYAKFTKYRTKWVYAKDPDFDLESALKVDW